MSFVGLALAYLRRRWGQALLSVVVGALGIAAVATAMVGFDALPRAARQAWGGVDLVVGSKGSALDLVLCCALHVADPRGLVSTKTAMAAVHSPMVRAAAPIALGDNVRGWRIVGTTPALLQIYHARFAQGGPWTGKLQAVAGAIAARTLGLKPGDTFVGAHGLAGDGELHEHFPYTVVGILQPTGSVLDRLVLTDIDTVRYVHVEQARIEKEERGSTDEDEGPARFPDAATAIVAAYRVPTAALLMQRRIDASDGLSAANPSLEIARLLGYARPVTVAVAAFGLLLAAIAAAGAAVGLLATMTARTKDLALLRVLGARRFDLATVALSEAAVIGAAALVLGGLLAVALLALARDALAERTGLLLQPEVGLFDAGMVIGGTVLVTLLAAAVPALRALHADIEELLQS
ncbi:FtsX-like permease family protein [Reyranella sp.]|uniref:FtsX-like permease family protein n=1 Tax=Reyranella sp. TaxID=1929291 RepID=UPI003BAABC36